MTSGLVNRTALVLYGTETGTSQDLAEELGQILERFRFQSYVLSLDCVSPNILSCFTLTVFVVSTTGQGDFPSNAKAFWTSLLKKKLDCGYLKGIKYALVGLGDSSYPKFNFAARKLDKRLLQLGATEIGEPCEADEQGDDSTERAFVSWCQAFKTSLSQEFPLPAGETPLSDDISLPSKRILESSFVDSHHKNADKFKGVSNTNFPSAEPDIDQRLIPGSVPAVLESNVRMTPEMHWQDVRYLTLSLESSMPYLPGDALAILPKNFYQDVDALIELMGWSGLADSPIRIKHDMSTVGPSLGHPDLAIAAQPMTLRSLLANFLDITAIPRRSFFAKIAKYTSNEMHQGRLLEFSDPQYIDEYYDYATRPRRSILEILQEFDSVKIPWEEAINIFPVMRPRQFSIASGGSLKRNADGTSRFELLVAIVKYRTVIKKIRQGVCTRYLAALPAGSRLNIILRSEGRLHSRPQEFTGSHILIGAGTGIAPLRAVLFEKDFVHRKLGATESSTLIFGCRSENADYFFKDEWKAKSLQQKDPLRLLTAFSRDQKGKIYVQDRIREEAETLFAELYDNKATVVLCGSSGSMPKAVREALLEVLAEGFASLGISASERRSSAETYLADMEKSGRFRQETW
ncbi:putative nadph-dependent fmn fad containing oxidoreductase [Phaeomoniella chlamydospora]|uniref:NADPH-dependent diflavin oxidoreductase 1 n=1 Tax=Phaeomoniella chlamydospora TaxID=158046 RepID=A0A0G2E1B6_PHACM|nr:putative nadph-dependent fmn fad containing oxidoreductase [Phaeomoniella chlamydospora]